MSSIHEFDAVFSPGIQLEVSPTRAMCREAHLNPWVAGVKGTGAITFVGNSTVNGTSAPGIQLQPARPGAAATNMPTELVLGSTQAAPGLLDLREVFAINSSAHNFSVIAIP